MKSPLSRAPARRRSFTSLIYFSLVTRSSTPGLHHNRIARLTCSHWANVVCSVLPSCTSRVAIWFLSKELLPNFVSESRGQLFIDGDYETLAAGQKKAA